ncbi:hypothetical protein [Bacillus cereus]|uniref:Uncharacterized protein n=1 Tax=Bacillus cereus (strain VD146) TaxID=1053236 RepID=R8NKD1_BACCX|nr:hypothetical protein [Bacillus cereus]EOP46528.1 hypothetical protein IK1_06211 [Bacillus cereus VD146]
MKSGQARISTVKRIKKILKESGEEYYKEIVKNNQKLLKDKENYNNKER